MTTIYIYALQDPRDERIRYVGKTRNPKSRLSFHLQCKDVNLHKVRWIQQLKAVGLKPAMIILEKTTESAWQEREKYWIAFGRQNGWPLTNISEGGAYPGTNVNVDDALSGYIDTQLMPVYERLSQEQKLELAKGAVFVSLSYYKQVFAYWFRNSDKGDDVAGSSKAYLMSREYVNAQLAQPA